MLSQKKIKLVLEKLSSLYPSPKPELLFTTPFELLIATMLSAQTTDRQVNICTRKLFPVYNTPQALSEIDEETLFPYIQTCGLYKTKGKHILEACRLLLLRHGGEVPKTREELIALPGVGRKTANVVLSNAFSIPAIAVDTHVFRVSNRIGLANAKDVNKTEEQLMKHIPKKDWGDAHHWIIFHGRRVCAARDPKCASCALITECEHYAKAKK